MSGFGAGSWCTQGISTSLEPASVRLPELRETKDDLSRLHYLTVKSREGCKSDPLSPREWVCLKKETILLVEGKRIYVDKAKMAAMSSYFNVLFYGGFKKFETQIVPLEYGSHRLLMACVQICDGKRPRVLETIDGIAELMAAADFFDFPFVRLVCELSRLLLEPRDETNALAGDDSIPKFDKKTATSDVVLVIGDNEIHLDKKMLCAVSPRFMRLFKDELNEAGPHRMDIDRWRYRPNDMYMKEYENMSDYENTYPDVCIYKAVLACFQICSGYKPCTLGGNLQCLDDILSEANFFDIRIVKMVCEIALQKLKPQRSLSTRLRLQEENRWTMEDRKWTQFLSSHRDFSNMISQVKWLLVEIPEYAPGSWFIIMMRARRRASRCSETDPCPAEEERWR